MGTEAIVAAALALGNLVLGFFALFQRARNRMLTEQFDTVAEGMRIVEQAVNDNKDLIARTGYGDKIALTIKQYGPAAALSVDVARQMAKSVEAMISAAKAQQKKSKKAAKAQAAAVVDAGK